MFSDKEKHEIMESIGKRFSYDRQRLGKTQEDAAVQFDVSIGTISGMENSGTNVFTRFLDMWQMSGMSMERYILLCLPEKYRNRELSLALRDYDDALIHNRIEQEFDDDRIKEKKPAIVQQCDKTAADIIDTVQCMDPCDKDAAILLISGYCHYLTVKNLKMPLLKKNGGLAEPNGREFYTELLKLAKDYEKSIEAKDNGYLMFLWTAFPEYGFIDHLKRFDEDLPQGKKERISAEVTWILMRYVKETFGNRTSGPLGTHTADVIKTIIREKEIR